jgi:hypothetical protein
MIAAKLTIPDPVLTPDGKIGLIGEFDTGGDGRMMAKVNFKDHTYRWYDINKITHAL